MLASAISQGAQKINLTYTVFNSIQLILGTCSMNSHLNTQFCIQPEFEMNTEDSVSCHSEFEYDILCSKSVN